MEMTKKNLWADQYSHQSKQGENSENKWILPGDRDSKENKLRYKESHSKTPRCAPSLSVCMYVFMYIPQEGKKKE